MNKGSNKIIFIVTIFFMLSFLSLSTYAAIFLNDATEYVINPVSNRLFALSGNLTIEDNLNHTFEAKLDSTFADYDVQYVASNGTGFLLHIRFNGDSGANTDKIQKFDCSGASTTEVCGGGCGGNEFNNFNKFTVFFDDLTSDAKIQIDGVIVGTAAICTNFSEIGEINFTGPFSQARIKNNLVTADNATPEANTAPVLEPVGDKTVNENQLLTIQLNASDADNDPLTFGTNAASVLPSVFTFNIATGLFEWTPTSSDAGNYTVTFNVTDGELSDEETITITVLDVVNNAPVLDPIIDKMVEENQLLTIQLNASDADSDPLTFGTNAASVLPSVFTFNIATGLFEWTPTSSDAGNYTVTFNVTDGELSDEETITIEVKKPGGEGASPVNFCEGIEEFIGYSVDSVEDFDLPVDGDCKGRTTVKSIEQLREWLNGSQDTNLDVKGHFIPFFIKYYDFEGGELEINTSCKVEFKPSANFINVLGIDMRAWSIKIKSDFNVTEDVLFIAGSRLEFKPASEFTARNAVFIAPRVENKGDSFIGGSLYVCGDIVAYKPASLTQLDSDLVQISADRRIEFKGDIFGADRVEFFSNGNIVLKPASIIRDSDNFDLFAGNNFEMKSDLIDIDEIILIAKNNMGIKPATTIRNSDSLILNASGNLEFKGKILLVDTVNIAVGKNMRFLPAGNIGNEIDRVGDVDISIGGRLEDKGDIFADTIDITSTDYSLFNTHKFDALTSCEISGTNKGKVAADICLET